jgi:hypothetical protein
VEADALPGQRTIRVTQVEGLDPHEELDLIIADRRLPPNDRRYEIEDFDPQAKTLTVDKDFPQRILRGTRLLLRSKRLQVRVDPQFRKISLTQALKRTWDSGTRLVRFPRVADQGGGSGQPLLFQLDISREPHLSQRIDLPVPDCFRFFEFQLQP